MKRFLDANYKVWKYASRGQKDFKCKKCGHCCRNCGSLLLMPDEYKRFREELSSDNFYRKKISNTDIYMAAIRQPCPFLQDNRCSIHNDRPFVCRMFPLKLNTSNYPYVIQFKINKVCDRIEDNETVVLDYDYYMEILKNCATYFNPENWIEYQDKIREFDDLELSYSEPTKPRTWCSVCNRTFDNPSNHSHEIPQNIENRINYINKMKEKFDSERDLFTSLLFGYLKNMSEL